MQLWDVEGPVILNACADSCAMGGAPGPKMDGVGTMLPQFYSQL